MKDKERLMREATLLKKYENADTYSLRSIVRFSENKYFANYTSIAEGIAEDLVEFANLEFVNEQEKEVEQLKEIMNLPIYRGYIKESDCDVYLDLYKYNGNIYTESQLSEKLNDRGVVFDAIERAEIDVDDDPFEYDTKLVRPSSHKETLRIDKQFRIGVSELFYYKDGPDGLSSPYVMWEDGQMEKDLEDIDEEYEGIEEI